MCQAQDYFIFCSCSDKNEDPNTDEHTLYYTWDLWRYLGSKKARMRGKIMASTKDLKNGITVDAILDQLNSDITSFDFAYTPSHRDCLYIRIFDPIERFRYFSLIFMDGQWKEGSNYVFTSITEKIANGNIKRHTNSSQKDEWVIFNRDTIENLFNKLLTSTDTRKQWDYISELVQRKPKECFDRATQLFTSKLQQERLIGCRLFVRLYDTDYEIDTIFNLLLEHLKLEKEEEIISLILTTISYQNERFSEEQIVFLSTFKTCRDDIKYSLMYAFGELKNNTVIDVFIELSNDKNPEIRETAISNLGDLWEKDPIKVSKALWNAVQDEHKQVRYYAILELSKWKDQNLKTTILKEIETIHPKGWLLLSAIENLNDKSFIPHIELQIEKHKNTSNYLTKLLQETIDKLNSNQ